MTREEVIAALEKAEGPSRELDWAVHAAIHPWLQKAVRYSLGYTDVTGREDPDHLLWWVEGRAEPYHDHLPRYTASLDEALSLAGERWLPVLLSAVAVLVGWLAEIRDKNGHLMRRLVLNVCAEALKARQS